MTHKPGDIVQDHYGTCYLVVAKSQSTRVEEQSKLFYVHIHCRNLHDHCTDEHNYNFIYDSMSDDKDMKVVGHLDGRLLLKAVLDNDRK